MASVRSRRRRSGVFWFVVSRQGRERAAGPGREGERAARRWEARLEAAEWAERRQEPTETALGAAWSVEDLRGRDLEAFRGRASWRSRERVWRVLLSVYGAETRLEALTPARIQAAIAERSRTVSAQTIRNELSVLSAALRLARRMRHESRFTADPLREVFRPSEPAGRRQALPEDEARAVIAAAWRKAARAPAHLRATWRDNAAIVELMFETSSRISQVLALRREQIAGDVLRFPPQKGGLPREFVIRGRLAAVLRKIPDRGPYLFPARPGARKAHRDGLARFWRAIAPPGFQPHGLRHSSVTAALEAGEGLMDVTRRGGWKTPAMVLRTYGHVLRRPIEALPRAGTKTAVTAGRPRRSRAVNPGKTSNGSNGGDGSKGRPARVTRPRPRRAPVS